jgi:hypothetical protein
MRSFIALVTGCRSSEGHLLILLERGVNTTLAERRLMSGGWMKPLDAAFCQGLSTIAVDAHQWLTKTGVYTL